MLSKQDREVRSLWRHSSELMFSMKCLSFCVQDSSSSGSTVKRLEADAMAQVKGIEKSIAAKKKEVNALIRTCDDASRQRA